MNRKQIGLLAVVLIALTIIAYKLYFSPHPLQEAQSAVSSSSRSTRGGTEPQQFIGFAQRYHFKD